MLNWLRNRSRRQRTARDFYGSIVTAARQPRFYAADRVPDTAEGRLEILALHLVAVLDRLQRMGAAGRPLARELGEVFIADMDDNMRELGVGDLAVPRKVKRMAALLSDRYTAYLAEPGGGIGALALAIERQVHMLPGGRAADCTALAHHLSALVAALAGQHDADLLAGRVTLDLAAPDARMGTRA